MPSIDVLIVEDEDPKRVHIERYVRSLVPDASLRLARSVNAALDALDEHLPDLLLLDMSLPTFDIGGAEGGGRPQGFGGREVMRHMQLSDRVRPTIVITGYEAFSREAGKPVELTQIRAELKQEFSAFCRGVLHYNSTYDEWKLALESVFAELGIPMASRK